MEENKIATAIAVLDGKVDGLKDLFTEKFEQNSREHKEITKRQDTANHRTTKLEEWKEAHAHNIEAEMSEKFASKRVERHFDKLVLAVIIAVLLAGVGLILK